MRSQPHESPEKPCATTSSGRRSGSTRSSTGSFVLRSGQRSSYYVDKYRFATEPVMLEQLGARLAETVASADPTAVRLAAPELGAVPLAAAASLSSRLPFVIVRKEPKDYGTAKRLEGEFSPGDRVCLLEDVVTTGGASVDAVQAPARGGAGVLDRGMYRRSRVRRCGRAGARRGQVVAPLSHLRVHQSPENPRKTRMVERIRRGCYAAHNLKRPRGEEYW